MLLDWNLGHAPMARRSHYVSGDVDLSSRRHQQPGAGAALAPPHGPRWPAPAVRSGRSAAHRRARRSGGYAGSRRRRYRFPPKTPRRGQQAVSANDSPLVSQLAVIVTASRASRDECYIPRATVYQYARSSLRAARRVASMSCRVAAMRLSESLLSISRPIPTACCGRAMAIDLEGDWAGMAASLSNQVMLPP